MIARTNRWLMIGIAVAALATTACNPFQEATKGAPSIVRVMAYDSASGDGVDTPTVYDAPVAGVWTIANANQGSFGATYAGAARPGKRVGLAFMVQINKPLNGATVQATAADCTPATGAFTFPAAPAGEAWYACYNPGNPDVTVGGSILIFKSQTSPASRKNDPRVAVYEPATDYPISGTVKDQDGTPLTFSLLARVSAERIDSVNLTPATGSVTVDWAAAAGAASYDVYRALNVADPVNGDVPGDLVKLTSSSITALTYTDATTVAGTKYWYAVLVTGTNATTALGAPNGPVTAQ